MTLRTLLQTTAVTAFSLGVFAIAATAQQQQRPAQQPPPPPKPMKELIVGSWTPLLVDDVDADGTRSPIYGPNPKGMLMFSPDGRYSLQIMRDIRPKFAANSRLKGTADENKAVIGGIITHFGRYSLDEGAKTITLRIDGSSFPNWDGTSQTRPITALTDDVFTYVNPASSGSGGKSEVAWRRAK
jgi:hypothetical protein